MKVLLVTGKLAEKRVKKVAHKFHYQVYVASDEVASLIKPKVLAGKLKEEKIHGLDMVIVPGLITGDLAVVEKATGMKTYMGPRDVADLEYVLKNLGKIELSKKVPADVLLKDELRKRAYVELEKVIAPRYIESKLKLPGNFLIHGLPVGKAFPMRVVAEIVDAGNVVDEDVVRRAEYYIREGADIIDIGMNEEDPERVRELIELLRPMSVPLSIDTMEEENIRSALENEIDLVLSFDHELLMRFKDVSTPAVIIPKRDGIPPEPEERLKLMEENIKLAEERGFKYPIADLVLQPANMGLVDSLAAYRKYAAKHDDAILMGVGNVTELMDADSPGINALLCAAAMECRASLLFTTEASGKTTGSVRELSTAAKMMLISSQRKSVPVNLGIDLLMSKEKKVKREVLDENIIKNIRKIHAASKKTCYTDKKGYFKIFVDENIKCVHYYKNKPHILIEGNTAGEINDTVYSLGLIEDIGHALYLGRELAKAEESLKYHRSYQQS